jgi:hypothetical protein
MDDEYENASAVKHQLQVLENAKSDEYSPEWGEFDYEELKTMPNFQIRLFPEALFMGQIVDGKRSGKGVMKYSPMYNRATLRTHSLTPDIPLTQICTSNRLYEGEWVDDIR